MEYVLLTISFGDVEEDLKVSAFIPAGELIGVFNELYNTDGRMLHAEPKGIILDKNKTLAQQGVGHGAKLALS